MVFKLEQIENEGQINLLFKLTHALKVQKSNNWQYLTILSILIKKNYKYFENKQSNKKGIICNILLIVRPSDPKMHQLTKFNEDPRSCLRHALKTTSRKAAQYKRNGSLTYSTIGPTYPQVPRSIYWQDLMILVHIQ